MPIHSLPDRGDPRVVAGLLAKEVLATIDAAHERQMPSSFISFIRLLDTYRHDAFRTRKQRGVLERSDNVPRRPPAADTTSRVRQALAAAHAEVFGDASRPEVVAYLIRVLEPCFREDRPQPSPAEIDKTKRFIEALIRNLRP